MINEQEGQSVSLEATGVSKYYEVVNIFVAEETALLAMMAHLHLIGLQAMASKTLK